MSKAGRPPKIPDPVYGGPSPDGHSQELPPDWTRTGHIDPELLAERLAIEQRHDSAVMIATRKGPLAR